MSTWRKKAIECLPEEKKELENPTASIYAAFREILGVLPLAHLNNDHERLKKIYAFAEWCFRQKEKDLWNAAGVSFYEHLGDHEAVFEQMHNWVSREIYQEIRGLLELRIINNMLKKLDKEYAEKHR
jgi:hypothetical protein